MPDQDNSRDLNVISDIGAMPPGTILTVNALAQIFGRDRMSIFRAINRGELPRPTELLGCHRFTAGAIIKHIEKRMEEAEMEVQEIRAQSR